MKNQTRCIYEVGNVLHQDIHRIEGACLFITDQNMEGGTPEQVLIFPWPRDAAWPGHSRLGSRSVPLRARALWSRGAPSPPV